MTIVTSNAILQAARLKYLKKPLQSILLNAFLMLESVTQS